MRDLVIFTILLRPVASTLISDNADKQRVCHATQSHYRRVSESQVTVEWWVPQGTPLGTYRLHVYGQSKNLLGHISPYEGTSKSFVLTA